MRVPSPYRFMIYHSLTSTGMNLSQLYAYSGIVLRKPSRELVGLECGEYQWGYIGGIGDTDNNFIMSVDIWQRQLQKRSGNLAVGEEQK
ncbi:uncharacterized protein LAJ45_00728 [Morchella importuna]|uniref:uncharacterized protein n=1 Tax=Morchella importuna TaxID=1174673 RepID=UPI001E8E834D|nr:uncharacterized protein LAJ45_00728 [Morchella importuna]KAH8155718.1 hypothetical protein LAJ45_00728 [Morchella importuna]